MLNSNELMTFWLLPLLAGLGLSIYAAIYRIRAFILLLLLNFILVMMIMIISISKIGSGNGSIAGLLFILGLEPLLLFFSASLSLVIFEKKNILKFLFVISLILSLYPVIEAKILKPWRIKKHQQQLNTEMLQLEKFCEQKLSQRSAVYRSVFQDNHTPIDVYIRHGRKLNRHEFNVSAGYDYGFIKYLQYKRYPEIRCIEVGRGSPPKFGPSLYCPNHQSTWNNMDQIHNTPQSRYHLIVGNDDESETIREVITQSRKPLVVEIHTVRMLDTQTGSVISQAPLLVHNGKYQSRPIKGCTNDLATVKELLEKTLVAPENRKNN